MNSSHCYKDWEISLPERQNNIGVIRTVRDFLPFLCNSIFLVWYNLLSNIRVFISDPCQGHNILVKKNSNEKKGLSNKQKGLIAQHTGEDTSQQRRDTPLQGV